MSRLIKIFLKLYSNFQLKVRPNENYFLIIISFVVGVATSFGALFFRWFISASKTFFLDKGGFMQSHFGALGGWLIPLVPALGGLLVGPIVFRYAREARGHGVPEVMEAVALKGGIIRPRMALAKVVASGICLGSGGSAGREGPIVAIGSSVGSSLAQLFKMSSDRIRILVACGAAAGIAATFNAPIAGVLFALEIILGDFAVRAFGPVVLSAVISSVISRSFLGNFPAFKVPSYALVSAYEIPLYIVLGWLAGMAAVLFIKALYFSEDFFEKLRIKEIYKPALGGLLLGLIGWQFPQIFGVGYETVDLALYGQIGIWLLISLIFLKILGTSLTLGSGSSGGIFAPSLFMGAMLGGAFGILVHNWFPELTASPGAYALVGMSAVVSGTTHAPITAMLITFEMTSDYRIILGLMIACVFSVLTSQRLSKESIYTLKLARRGINIRAGKDISILEKTTVGEVMQKEWESVPQNLTLRRFWTRLDESPSGFWAVLDERDRLLGLVTLNDLRLLLNKQGLEDLLIVGDMVRPSSVVAHPDENLRIALSKFGMTDAEVLAVVDRIDSGKLLGILKKGDVSLAYEKKLFEKEIPLGK